MTPKQKVFHWREWSKVCGANCWRMASGRISEQADRTRSEWHRAVWGLAEQLALQAHRGVTVDDLRHASYLVATESRALTASSSQLTNKQFNRVLALWRLLVDPENIRNVMMWQNPEIAERDGLIDSIHDHAPGEAYIETVAYNKFGKSRWRDLTLEQLRQLAMTMTGRARKFQEKGKPRMNTNKHELEEAGNPF